MSEDYEEGYESGPFCQHWGDPSDCEEECDCGHTCASHCYYLDDCNGKDCECLEFTQEKP